MNCPLALALLALGGTAVLGMWAWGFRMWWGRVVCERTADSTATVVLTNRNLLRGQRGWHASLTVTGVMFWARQREPAYCYYSATIAFLDGTVVKWGPTDGYQYKYAQRISLSSPFNIPLGSSDPKECSVWEGAKANVKVQIGDRHGTLCEGSITACEVITES